MWDRGTCHGSKEYPAGRGRGYYRVQQHTGAAGAEVTESNSCMYIECTP